MTDYRIVSRHVRYWRGSVHKWSTVWRFVGTIPSASYGTALTAIHDLEQAVNYPGISTHQGGLYEVALYNQSSGGVPIDTVTYFDYTNPAGWINYTGSAWASPFGVAVGSAEIATVAEWSAGVSTTGKPVRFRKWFHMTPVTTGTSGAADISSADVSSLQSAIDAKIAIVGGLGAPMGSGSRLAATTSVVLPHFGAHQMPRGRRRKPLVTASGRYTGPAILGPRSPLPVAVD